MTLTSNNHNILPEGCNLQCNGCSHRYLTKAESELQKYSWLKKTLNKWEDKIHPVNGMDENHRWAYRGKVKLSVQYVNKTWQFGMWKRKDFIPIHDCPVHKPFVNELVQLFSSTLPPYYDFPLHFLYIADKQVTLILKTKTNPDLTWFSDEVKKQIISLGIDALWIHLNPAAGYRLFEKTPWILVWGSRNSIDYKGLLYGPASFHQLTPCLYQQSLEVAKDFLQPDTESLIIDLYCGTGHSLKCWEQQGAKTIGIESSREAVECTMKNVPGAIVLRGQCHHRVKQLTSIIQGNNFSGLKPLLYVNPPRTGLGIEVLNWITQIFQPVRIAYLSCSAGTLCRDLEELNNNGYEVNSVIPFDFFPNTYHIETLTFLLKKYN